LKPPKFQYHAPDTIAEAVDLLAQHDGNARVLAGGQSLVPMMNFRLTAPAALIDLRRIESLTFIRDESAHIAIGAMTRQRAAEQSSIVASRVPLLREALRWVGHLPTRSRGTIGGSIAHADPSAELPMVLLAMEGEVIAQNPRGERTIAADDLFQSFFTTSLAADEVLTTVRFPAMNPRTGYAMQEFARRHGDFAIVAVAALIDRNGPRCTRARLVATGVGGRPLRFKDAEALLERDGLAPAVIHAASQSASAAIDPVGDANASAEFRRHITQVLVERTLTQAIAKTTP
jgi:aerobic carbon-monoxide dehydrogenase medium subunit